MKEVNVSKYAPLEKHLKSSIYTHVPMTFSQIESIIHDSLPPSARKHRAWWSNNPRNSVITYAWLAAGYKASDVNLEGETVTFVKEKKSDEFPQPKKNLKVGHPIFGAMKGSVTVEDGYDLTQPADPEWGKVYE